MDWTDVKKDPPCVFEKALVERIEHSSMGEKIIHGEWEDCNDIDPDIKEILMHGRAISPYPDSVVIGGHIYHIK